MEAARTRGFHWRKFFLLRCNLRNLLYACALRAQKKISFAEFNFRLIQF